LDLLTHILAVTMLMPLTLGSAAQESSDETLTSGDLINRKAYVDFVVRELKPESLMDNPNRGQYGPRHALPALAVYSFTGEKEYGETIKKILKFYHTWLQEEIQAQGAHFSWEGPYLCGFHFRELRKGGLMSEEDEKWARDLLIALASNLNAWKPSDGLWRGSHHRSQGQAIARGLAALWYPDYSKAKAWEEYFGIVWNDWWQYRDVGINDTGYFYGSFMRIFCAAELMGMHEVFTDPDVKKFIWDRLLYEITPEGAVMPYGSHNGWNAEVGIRILALELAAARTGDGRYRWAAHRLMNYLMKHGGNLYRQNHVHAINMEAISLASLVCDDTIEPVTPDDSSRVLYRKEVVRLTNEQVLHKYPVYGGLDCNMDMTQKIMPHKVILSSGWNPGDFRMLIEAFPRHDPLNPTAIVGVMSHGSAMAIMASEKFVSRENAVRIEDLSGEAIYMGKSEYQGIKMLPTGYDGMEVEVKRSSDHELATHVTLNVTNYMGYNAEHEREIFFIKNRFAVVRDVTTFQDTFKGRVGPVWNTQHVEMHSGDNWLNTYFSKFYTVNTHTYDNPRHDLLVYHVPKSDCKLVVEQRNELMNAGLSSSYVWEGSISPGFKAQFSQVLLPHSPQLSAAEIANRIRVIIDEQDQLVLEIRTDEGSVEWIVLNSQGAELEVSPDPQAGDFPLTSFQTDSRAVYLAFKDKSICCTVAIDTTFLRIDGEDIFIAQERRTFESGKTGH